MARLAAAFFGFASGIVVSGAVFAFITVIGVVPRMAEKTKTAAMVRLYEDSIMCGGIAGTVLTFTELCLPLGKTAAAVLSFCCGIFYGALAMSLAEVLDVIPVLTRRVRVRRGMYYFVLALALGKLLGSLMYYTIPGFFIEN